MIALCVSDLIEQLSKLDPALYVFAAMHEDGQVFHIDGASAIRGSIGPNPNGNLYMQADNERGRPYAVIDLSPAA